MAGASFRFRLERVRALRERAEETARQELARALASLADSEDRLRAVDVKLAQAQAEQRGSARPLTGTELAARQAFLERVERQRTVSANDLQRNEGEVANRSAELGRAAQDHQMLERLKERDQAAHAREVQRREAIALDEIAIDRFRRHAA